MINSKERSQLAGLAQKIAPIFQIGKNGITDVLINELSDALDARELIKITLLKNSELEVKDVMVELCERLGADPVSAIGFKITIYRLSTKKDVKHVIF